MTTKKFAFSALLVALLTVASAAPASAQFGLLSPFTGLAATVAKAIVTTVRGDNAPASAPVRVNIDSTVDTKNAEARAFQASRVQAFIEELRRTAPRATLPIALEAQALDARLTQLEDRDATAFQDLEQSMKSGPAAAPPAESIAVETDNLPAPTGKAYVDPENKLAALKEASPNSSAFTSFFAGLKESLKPETKTWVTTATRTDSEKNINPPDVEVKFNTGTSVVIDKFENKQKSNYHWDNDPSVADAFTSKNLNLTSDPKLQNTLLGGVKNDQFEKVSLLEGTPKFGWTHIATDRPDGTCHAREIKSAFGLPDQDKAVQDFILDSVKNGKAEEQVRMVNGAEQRRMIYTREVDGKELTVVVDKDKFPGSLITAYPSAGKFKTPKLAEVQKMIEEEAARKAEEAKKNVKWRNPTLSVDFYKRERTVAVGPQWKAGAEQKFRLGGAEIVNAASIDTLLGGEATGALYGGFRDGVLAAGVRGSVFAGARARGNLSSQLSAGDLGLKGFVGGEASAGAGANADAHVGVGKNGLEASVNGDAFVGVRAKGQVGGTLSYGDVKVTGSVNGTIGAGLGAHFDVTGKLGWSGVKAHVDLGAYLGVGGQFGFDINLDFGHKLDPLKKAVEGVVDKGKQVVGNVKNGIKKLFGWK